ncbi:MAG: hypothetical protein SVO01_12180 [Thermotogota bacterium]|nr:hypothetical protein [Thermotogota bacterium]
MNRTLEKRITKLECYADRSALMPPPELISYLRGKEIEEEKIEEEKIKFQQILDKWMAGMDRAAARGLQIDKPLLDEILNALPEPVRTEVREGLIEKCKASQSEK